MKKITKIILNFIIFALFLQFFPLNIANANSIKSDNYEAMVTIESSTGRVLYEKDKDKKLPMASTTKILTAIVAIENTDDLDKKHSIPKEAVGIEGSSIYLRTGEKLSIRELLYGLMLRSGNDSAVAIAILTAGSVEKFVELMNDYCKKLNLFNTHIVTVNGLHNDNHYTSASDLANITAYALKNETFKEIVSTKEKIIDSTLDEKNKCRLLKNKNKLLKMVDGANGVKTGYTTKAGKCFVGSATRGDMSVITVVLNAKTMFDDSATLIEKAFQEYRKVKLLDKGEIITYKTNDKKPLNYPIILRGDVVYVLSKEELAKLKASLNVNEDALLGCENLEDIGTIDFRIENDLIFSEKIYTIKGKNTSKIKENFNKIVKAF